MRILLFHGCLVMENFYNYAIFREEAVWLEKQGEVSSTVERLQVLQNDIQSYK